MEKPVFFLLFTLLILSCHIVAQVNTAAPTISRYPKEARKRSHNNTRIDKSLFDASELIIDESLLVAGQTAGLKENDKIESLPGQPTKVKFNQYSGHVVVDEKAGRALFYYFAEARDYHQDASPLLLWISGCSSFGVGAMEEMGPFRVYSDGQTLYENNYAWNQVANVLFLESPAGTGFSYSNTTTDYVTGDRQTAIDNYSFLVKWLDRFPEYKTRDIYLGGENNGGHYAPELAQIILKQNPKSAKSSSGIINLKGIIIGNAQLNYETQKRGEYEYFESHALISDDSADALFKYCNFSAWDDNQPPLCYEMLDIIEETVGGSINIHNIYATPCPSSTTPTENPNKASIFEYDPCSDIYVTAYMRRPDVKRALHANGAKIPWIICSDVLRWTDSPFTVLPIIKELINHGVRVWIYTGDLNGGSTGLTSTQLAIKAMNLGIKDPWRPWFSNTRKHREVAGYTQEYKDNLIFATVRGAGDRVPSYQPERALTLITSFLAGVKPPIK